MSIYTYLSYLITTWRYPASNHATNLSFKMPTTSIQAFQPLPHTKQQSWYLLGAPDVLGCSWPRLRPSEANCFRHALYQDLQIARQSPHQMSCQQAAHPHFQSSLAIHSQFFTHPRQRVQVDCTLLGPCHSQKRMSQTKPGDRIGSSRARFTGASLSDNFFVPLPKSRRWAPRPPNCPLSRPLRLPWGVDKYKSRTLRVTLPVDFNVSGILWQIHAFVHNRRTRLTFAECKGCVISYSLGFSGIPTRRQLNNAVMSAIWAREPFITTWTRRICVLTRFIQSLHHTWVGNPAPQGGYTYTYTDSGAPMYEQLGLMQDVYADENMWRACLSLHARQGWWESIWRWGQRGGVHCLCGNRSVMICPGRQNIMRCMVVLLSASPSPSCSFFLFCPWNLRCRILPGFQGTGMGMDTRVQISLVYRNGHDDLSNDKSQATIADQTKADSYHPLIGASRLIQSSLGWPGLENGVPKAIDGKLCVAEKVDCYARSVGNCPNRSREFFVVGPPWWLGPMALGGSNSEEEPRGSCNVNVGRWHLPTPCTFLQLRNTIYSRLALLPYVSVSDRFGTFRLYFLILPPSNLSSPVLLQSFYLSQTSFHIKQTSPLCFSSTPIAKFLQFAHLLKAAGTLGRL